MQILGISPLSNYHSVVHSLLIDIFYNIAGILTDDMNARIGLYTLFQMTFFAFCAAYVVYTLYKTYRLRFSLCLAVLAFYAFVPFMAVQSIFGCKDTIFAGILMLFCCELSGMVYAKREPSSDDKIMRRRHVFSWPRFVLLGILLCIFCPNGWYAFLMFTVCFFIIYIKEWKKALLYVVPVIGIALLIKVPVMNAYGVIQPDITVSLHVPEQQIARVIVNKREISDKDLKMLTNVIDISYVEEFYVPWFADNIKELLRVGNSNLIEENKLEYLKLWVCLGLRYPADYILAWKDLTETIIYPEGDYDAALIEGVFPNEIDLFHQPIIGGKLLMKLHELAIKTGSFIPLYGFYGAWVHILGCFFFLSLSSFRRRRTGSDL